MYDYWCQNCDTDIEKNVKISERDEQKCPDCGNRIVRAINAPGMVYAPTSGKTV